MHAPGAAGRVGIGPPRKCGARRLRAPPLDAGRETGPAAPAMRETDDPMANGTARPLPGRPARPVRPGPRPPDDAGTRGRAPTERDEAGEPMAKPPTMKDIAAAAGVSVMTVSRAMRDDTAVAEAKRLRIREVADRLGYVLDSTAANLRRQRTGFVAVTIPSINNANFADTVGGLSVGLAEHGLQVLLGYTNYDVAQEERLIRQLLQRRPEALVVTGGRHSAAARHLMRTAGIPVLETWDLPAEPIGHVVGFSNAETSRMTVEHLLAEGYRRITYVGGDTAGDTRGADRRRGFIETMSAHGMDASRLISAGRKAPVSMREGASAMAELLEVYPNTEAVICVSDLSAFGAVTECQRRGIRVPEDIAVAGFGNYEISGISVPSITTVDPFPARIGALASALIGKLLPATSPASPEVQQIEPILLARDTTRRQ